MLQTKSSIGEDYAGPAKRYADERQSAEWIVARVHHMHVHYVVFIFANQLYSMLKCFPDLTSRRKEDISDLAEENPKAFLFPKRGGGFLDLAIMRISITLSEDLVTARSTCYALIIPNENAYSR